MTRPKGVRLGPKVWAAANRKEAELADRRIAVRIAEQDPLAFEGCDPGEAEARVAEARAAYSELGVKDPARRMLFIEISCRLAPRFWMVEPTRGLLLAPTGTPDIRFGDVAAMLKAALTMAGRGHEVWW